MIGYHPSPLPRGRGRHPLIWTLALGLKELTSSFFVMIEEADAGDLVSQERVSILEDENAGDVYLKAIEIGKAQIVEIAEKALNDKLTGIPQDTRQATVWRKRGPDDGKIDWRMSAKSIHNLVRALSRPYPGAHCLLNQTEFKVWKTKVAADSSPHIIPGQVIKTDGRVFWVKCGEDAIGLLEHEFESIPKVGDFL